MWKIFQLSIMAAVMCGNIYFQWTPNPYLAGALGVGRLTLPPYCLVLCSVVAAPACAITRPAITSARSEPGGIRTI